MRHRLLIGLIVLSLFALPGPAAAQNRMPSALTLAAGLDAGAYVPDEEFHTGFTPAGFLEFYLIPRVSVRGLVGWSRNEFVTLSDRYLEQGRIAFNVVYNWEHEYWHPFVTIGGGAHVVRTWQDDLLQTDWQWRPALNAGIGIEYFARPKISFKFEATYYAVSRSSAEHESFGLAVSVGMKKYFF